MKKSFFIILILFFACSKKQTEIPADVLSQKQMVNLLIDIHILEAKVKKLYLSQDSGKAVYLHYEQMLFDKHGFSKEEYEKSLNFYIEEIEKLSDIYKVVSDSLLARTTLENFE